MSTNKPNAFQKLLGDIGKTFVGALQTKLNESHEARAKTSEDIAAAGFPSERVAGVSRWAGERGIGVRWPSDYARAVNEKNLARAYDIETSPCIDFGKVYERIPWFVLHPESAEQVCACLQFLSEEGIALKARGSGHSSGGQPLIEEGAVINLRGLSGVIEDDPEGETVKVFAGTTWAQLAEYLREQERRPVVLTDHLPTTIGGTLAVGGFGDTSSRHGPQISTVVRLEVATLDGTLHDVGPGDPLFDYTLAGRGQLGIMVSATLRTLSRSRQLASRLLRWPNMKAFVADSIRIIEEERFEYSLARYHWDTAEVKGDMGHFGEVLVGERAMEGLSGEEIGTRFVDVHLHALTSATPERWAQRYWPALEFALPLPSGMEVWPEIAKTVPGSFLHLALKGGSSVVVMRGDDRLPLAPLARSEYTLVVAIRPRIQGFQIPTVLSTLRPLRDLVLDAGGRIYLMSVLGPETPEQLEQQFGAEHLARLRELKQLHDPDGLLGPGLL